MSSESFSPPRKLLFTLLGSGSLPFWVVRTSIFVRIRSLTCVEIDFGTKMGSSSAHVTCFDSSVKNQGSRAAPTDVQLCCPRRWNIGVLKLRKLGPHASENAIFDSWLFTDKVRMWIRWWSSLWNLLELLSKKTKFLRMFEN